MSEVIEQVHPPRLSAIIAGTAHPFSSSAEKFQALADDWLDWQAGRSRVDFSHPSHLQIVGMGSVAIPYLLREIQRRSGHWFEALRAIVGTSPVSPEERGTCDAVAQAWIRWGVENGYGSILAGKGEGALRSAGGRADYPEMDAVMEQIHRDRKLERSPQMEGQ